MAQTKPFQPYRGNGGRDDGNTTREDEVKIYALGAKKCFMCKAPKTPAVSIRKVNCPPTGGVSEGFAQLL